MAIDENKRRRSASTEDPRREAPAPEPLDEEPPEMLDDDEVLELDGEEAPGPDSRPAEDEPSEDGDEEALLRSAGAETGEERDVSEHTQAEYEPDPAEENEVEETLAEEDEEPGEGVSTLEEPLPSEGDEGSGDSAEPIPDDAGEADGEADGEAGAPMFSEDEDTDHRRDFSQDEPTPPRGEVTPDEPPPWSAQEETTGRQSADAPRRSRRRRAVEIIQDEERTASGRGEREQGEPWSRADAEADAEAEATAAGEESGAQDEPAPEDDPSWSAVPAEGSAFPDAGPTRVESAFQPSPSGALLSEKTQILGQGAVEAPPPPYLIIVKGEEEGREIELSGRVFNMGRGADNDLVFPDIACSRRHAVLESDGEGYTLTDLGSGNGTLVNSRRIQKVRLADGDRIEIGNTILEFHAPGAGGSGGAGTAPRVVTEGTVTTSRPAAPPEGGGPAGPWLAGIMADPRKKRLFLIGCGVGGLLFLLILVKIVVGPGQPAGPTPDEVARAEQARAYQELNEHLTQAKFLVRDKKWREASLEINLALKLDPENTTAREYQRTVQRELQCAQALSTVRSFVEQKAWEQALRVVGSISSDCDQFEQAQEIRPQIENGMLEELVQQGQEMLRNKEYAQAVLKFEEVLKRAPEHTEAQILKKQAEGELEREAARLARAQAPRHAVQPVKPKPDSGGAISGQVLAFYRNGEVDKAVEKAEANGSPQAAKLKKLQGLYQRGKELARQHGEVSQAIKALEAAYALDREIAGGSGKIHDELCSLLAKSHFLKGMDAFSARNYPDSYRSFTTALKFQPDYKLAQDRLADLEKQAKKLFEEAYVIKSTNAEDAIKKLTVVMQIIPPDHLYYKKAKTLKASISGGGDEGSGGDSGF
ncbi:MAG: FHA domain-containing protein [Myxococcales bacterium]|nr:FHA domain-containing protein [Myxococcales bacterium]